MSLLAVLWAPLFLLSSAQNEVTGSIEGSIRVAAGSPEAGVRVFAITVPSAPGASGEPTVVVSITLSGADGRYRLIDIPPGRYYIATGAVANPTYYPGTPGLDSAAIVTVGGGLTLAGYDFPLLTPPPEVKTLSFRAMTRVFGRVVMADGSPLPKVELVKTSPGSTAHSNSALESGARFSLWVEPDVDFQLFVAGLPPQYKLGAIALGETDLGLGPINVPLMFKGELVLTVVPVPLSSVKTVTVSGKVANVAPEWKIGNRIVQLTSLDFGGPTVEAHLNPDNSFLADTVPPGTYQTLIEGLLGQRPVFPVVTVGDTDVSSVTIDLHNNPFPELPGSPFAPGYDTSNPITLRGVVTEEVRQVRGKMPFRYFRLDVRDDVSGTVTPWAVSFAGLGESMKLTVGETVTVTGVRAQDGTHRLTLDSTDGTALGYINGVPLPPAR